MTPTAPTCCTPLAAWAWVLDLAEAALDGDSDATRCLLAAIAHYLRIGREVYRGIPV